MEVGLVAGLLRREPGKTLRNLAVCRELLLVGRFGRALAILLRMVGRILVWQLWQPPFSSTGKRLAMRDGDLLGLHDVRPLSSRLILNALWILRHGAL